MTVQHPRHQRSDRPNDRLPDRGDDRGSMPMLLMVMIVGMVLGALLVPMIITQDRTTRFDTTRVHALGAAHAGLDLALGQIRAAVDSGGIGDSSKLPCGPLSGTVNSIGLARLHRRHRLLHRRPGRQPEYPEDDLHHRPRHL